MLASYTDLALEQAVYEIIEDDGTYWGEIPGLQGVRARHTTLEGCQRELRSCAERLDCAAVAFGTANSSYSRYRLK
ncbi:MAG: hypothetical protein MUC60_10085 [Oscillatoria sp. Prado101]|jgi:hypothetical protein|nr:hypothetical protein [Oscillatoria sp. Prado101]